MASVDKKTLRNDVLARRLGLGEAERWRLSGKIVEHMARLIADEMPRHVGIYLPVRGEVDVTRIAAATTGVVLGLPVVEAMGRGMAFHRWRPGKTVLGVNRFDIEEPIGEPRLTFTEEDLLFVPCLALDARGIRLGYGGGFYDAFLATTQAKPVGVAFSTCVLPSLPAEPHDRPLPRWVTEDGVETLAL